MITRVTVTGNKLHVFTPHRNSYTPKNEGESGHHRSEEQPTKYHCVCQVLCSACWIESLLLRPIESRVVMFTPCAVCNTTGCFVESVHAPRLQKRIQCSRMAVCQSNTGCSEAASASTDGSTCQVAKLSRRNILTASLCSAVAGTCPGGPAQAVQGYTAGRIPGKLCCF